MLGTDQAHAHMLRVWFGRWTLAVFHGHDHVWASWCPFVRELSSSPMSPHRLLILLLSLSILLLVPTNSGEATPAPVMQQMAVAIDHSAPADNDDTALPVAMLCAATEAPTPTAFSDDIGTDGLPAEPGTSCPLRRRIVALTIGGAPPPSVDGLTTPWPTGPPTL